MATSSRQYDIILFGATGYTGVYTAEHITKHLPTDLKWALAGRNAEKLAKLAAEIKPLNPDRAQPGIETSSLDLEDLKNLASKGHVLINTVGPYHKFSTPVVEACIESKTHYVDVTGESPWVLELIEKFHAKAQAAGVIVIPQCGVESAPSDLLAWAMVNETRKRYNAATREVVCRTSITDSTPSGGTLATALGIFDHYPVSHILKSTKPSAMCTVKPPDFKNVYQPSFIEKIFGVRNEPGLGYLTDSIFAGPDRPWVYRSWSLYDEGRFYGPSFRFSPYGRAKGWLQGVLMHFALTFGPALLLLSPLRWLLKKLVFQPGQGPSKESAEKGRLIYKAISTPDHLDASKVVGNFSFFGSMYSLSGLAIAEAAYTILTSKDTQAHKLRGGILTPATLGQPYIDRLANVGMKVTVEGA